MELTKEYNCIRHKNIILQKKINVDKNYQENLEAYLDDLLRIIKCKSHSFVTSCNIDNGVATIIGKSEIFITYLNENKELIYTDFVEEFEEKLNISSSSDMAFCNAFIQDKYCSYRIINQRRIDFHISFCIDANVFDETSYPSLSSCEGLKSLKCKKKICSFDNAMQTKIDIDENFDIPSGVDGISRVISFETNINNIESNPINDKAFIKANVDLCVLFTDIEGKCQKANYSFDISKIIEIANTSDESVFLTKFTDGCLFIKAKSSSNDAQGKIEIYGEFYANITVINCVEIEYNSDGYLVGYNTKNEYSSLKCCSNGRLYSNNYNSKLIINLKKEFSEIYSLDLKINNSQIVNDKLMLEIVATAFVRNVENEYEYITSSEEIEVNDALVGVIKHNAIIIAFDYNLQSNSTININIQYRIDYILALIDETKVLSDIKCVSKKQNSPVLTVYFANKNEEIWNIAKKFSSDISLIKKENNLKDNILDSNKILVIPGA